MSQRPQKVASIVSHTVAAELTELPGGAYLTVTGVDMAPDLRNCTVWIGVVPAAGVRVVRGHDPSGLSPGSRRLLAFKGHDFEAHTVSHDRDIFHASAKHLCKVTCIIAPAHMPPP